MSKEIIGDKNKILSELPYELQDGIQYRIEIKKYRKMRSINANNYCWALIEQLAIALGTSKDEVYETMLQRYGTFLRDKDNKLIVIPREQELQSSSKLHIKDIGNQEMNGKVLKMYAVIKGSSEYDTKEMTTFIDGIVSECKDLGIETLTQDELVSMKEEW